MGQLKTGYRLDTVTSLDDRARARLRGLSIVTVDEFAGFLRSEPLRSCEALELGDPQRLSDEVKDQVSPEFQSATEALPHFAARFGALRPTEATQAQIVVPEPAAGDADGNFPQTFRFELPDPFPEVANQWQRSTCVAFATVAVMEYVNPNNVGDRDFSEQYVYWAAEQTDGSPQLVGTFIRVAMRALQVQGVCSEFTWPYNPMRFAGNEGEGPPPAGAADAALANKLDRAVTSLPPKSVDAIRTVLDGGRPVALSIPVFGSWYINNSAVFARGEIQLPPPGSPEQQVGHAMCAVGYVADEDYAGGGGFIVRNSWGPEWAAHSPIRPGYGILPYAYVTNYGWEAMTIARPLV